MAVKKTELYSSLWASCDALRGGMDASQYKDYILTLLFVKYVTDKYIDKKHAPIKVFNKAHDPEKDSEKRVGCSFEDFVALKNDDNIGEGMDKIISRLANANPKLQGIIDSIHFNDENKIGKGKEKVDKLTKLISIFQNPILNFKENNANGDDIIGDAYEYLMKNFATQSGKSKGQFYTPAEVSRILAKVIGIDKCKKNKAEVCDPACGSGSLLIRALEEAPSKRSIVGYGQEKDVTTAGLAQMNAVLHDKATTTIKAGNTFSEPHFKEEGRLQRFDYIVANPPFSLKNWSDGIDDCGRFDEYGRPPETNGDYAWLLHILKSLKPNTGKAAVILPHGVLFRGNSEGEIRRKIIDRGFIKGIISLPANLFYGTGIPACIIVIDKEDAANRNGIFMIDASKDFVKDGNKNRLRERDVYKIVTTFNNMIKDNPKYARFVENNEIKIENDYNLNISRYIDTSEPEDLQDIHAHIHGGIPAVDIDSLNIYWDEFSELKRTLFNKYGEKYYKLNVTKDEVRQTVYSDMEFKKYGAKVISAFTSWKAYAATPLSTLKKTVVPKKLIVDLAEKILSEFETISLIDKYDVYQVLLEYWVETMNDDVFLIVSDEKRYALAKETENIKAKITSGKKKGQERVVGWDGRLIPKTIVIDAFFTKEKIKIQNAENTLAESESKLDEFLEENNTEDGIFVECMNADDNIDIKKVEARIRELKAKKSNSEEFKLLSQYIALVKSIKDNKKSLKDLNNALDEMCKKRYFVLTDKEILDLLVNRKWFASIENGIHALYTSISHRIANRITELAERYEQTLPELEDSVVELESKVKSHLERMGFTW